MCAAAFAIMLMFLIFVDGAENIADSLSRIKIPFLLLAIGCMVAYWFLEAATIHLPLRVVYKKQRFVNTFATTLIGQYFNCITPCASGGQPFQAYYLTKTGTPLAAAMTALLARFIVYQAALTIWSAVLLIVRFGYFAAELSPLMALTVVGFLVNLAVVVGLFMLAFFVKLLRSWHAEL